MNLTRSNSGFSLVEVMCAILILGVALAGLTRGVTTALASAKDSEYQTTAALYAAGRIETLRAEAVYPDGVTEGDCGEGLAGYRWKQSINGAGIDGLHEVEVVVENARSGKAIFELRTLLFSPPDSPTQNANSKQRDGSARKRGNRR